jgi:hypothetical protein
VKQLIGVIFLLFLCSHFYGQGAVIMQDKAFDHKQPHDSILENWLLKQKEYLSLPTTEREMVYWINLMRKDPNAFLDKYINPFLQQFPEIQGKESRSLVFGVKP